MFWLGFLCGIAIYFVLIAVLSVVKYRQLKKQRKEMLKNAGDLDLSKLQEFIKSQNVQTEQTNDEIIVESEDKNND